MKGSAANNEDRRRGLPVCNGSDPARPAATNVAVYINDIKVYNPTIEQHQRDLEEVFRRLEAASLRFSVSKTGFAQDLVPVLGNRVSAMGIKPNPGKVSAIFQLLEPANGTKIKRLMGMVFFYRRFIPGCSTLGEPRFVLCKNGAKFVWSVDQALAFHQMKWA